MLSSCIFFFKQKTAYELRISDWSSDVCSSDLGLAALRLLEIKHDAPLAAVGVHENRTHIRMAPRTEAPDQVALRRLDLDDIGPHISEHDGGIGRSEEHTSELQSLMRISYAVFCLKNKKNKNRQAKTRRLNN